MENTSIFEKNLNYDVVVKVLTPYGVVTLHNPTQQLLNDWMVLVDG